MNRFILPFLIIAVGTLTLTCCSSKKPPLRLATYTYDTTTRVDNLMLLAKDLEEQIGRKVTIKSYPNVQDFVTGINASEVDIALINTLGYLLLSLDNQYMETSTVLKIRPDAADNYKTVLLSGNNKIKSLEDVKDHAGSLSLRFVAKGSTSGNLIPRLMLSSIGINSPENSFATVAYGGTHRGTFNDLINGEIDLAAFGSNEYFSQIEKDSTLIQKSTLLWISEEIPLGPVLLHKELNTDEKQIITKLLLNLHRSNPEALEHIKKGWSEAHQADRYEVITESDYQDLCNINSDESNLEQVLELLSTKD